MNDTPKQPNEAEGRAKGTDSTVDEWFGQSVERDAEVADEVTDGGEHVDDEAERKFEERASGQEEQDARHGDHIDPDQGRRA